MQRLTDRGPAEDAADSSRSDAGAAWLYARGDVIGQEVEGDSAVYDVRMAPRDYERFQQRAG